MSRFLRQAIFGIMDFSAESFGFDIGIAHYIDPVRGKGFGGLPVGLAVGFGIKTKFAVGYFAKRAAKRMKIGMKGIAQGDFH